MRFIGFIGRYDNVTYIFCQHAYYSLSRLNNKITDHLNIKKNRSDSHCSLAVATNLRRPSVVNDRYKITITVSKLSVTEFTRPF